MEATFKLLVNDPTISTLLILSMIILSLILVSSSIEKDKIKFENNICPRCQHLFHMNDKKKIIKTETETHIHYACPLCFVGEKYLKL